MSVSVSNLLLEVQRLLREATNTTAGEVIDGVGGVTVTSNATIVRYLNEEREKTCRTCWPYFASATVSSVIAGTKGVNLQSVAPTAGGYIWAPREVASTISSTTTQLQYIDINVLRLYDSAYESAANGTTTYFYHRGANQLGLYAPPSGTASLAVNGLAIPPEMVTSGAGAGQVSSADFMPDEVLWQILPFGAASMIARNEMQDPNLFDRFALLRSEYNDIRMQLYTTMDESIRRVHYPLAPIPLGKGR